jgi:hypothetical protein
MRSDATTVEGYIAGLPDERRASLEAIRSVVLDNLPDGYVEAMRWGMISYEVPLEVEPDTYNGQPLGYAALASQKNHMALYLNGIYADAGLRESFERDYRASGKPFDVGKSCVRFRTPDDLPLDVIGEAIAAVPVSEFVALARSARRR